MIGGLRALLPDRPLLPRRGPARRPPARVHAARPRDVVRRGGGRHRADRRRCSQRRARRSAGIEVRAAARARSPTTRRCCATAPTAPTGASGWRSPTSTDVLPRLGVQGLRGALEAGGVVRGCKRRRGEFPRSRFDELTEQAQVARREGARLGGRRGRTALALADREVPLRGRDRAGDRARSSAQRGRRDPDRRRQRRGRRARARRRCGSSSARRRARRATTCFWVVDFPMFEWNEDERRWDALHHPFTAPTRRPRRATRARWRTRAYDLVLDGSELGGGSIRINRPDVQQQVFDALGIGPEEARGALRLPARGAALRRAAARRHRVRPRPHRGAARRPRVDPRRDRVPEDRQRRRPAHRRAGAGGRAPARRSSASRSPHRWPIARDPR